MTKLELYREYPPPGEDAAIAEIVRISTETLRKTYLPDNKPVRRDQHVKDHGCVKGEFIVEDNLPTELKLGVFKEPKTYPVWIRFSNGFEKSVRDADKDVRGMAIKLIGVEGEKILESDRFGNTQDFLAINYPTFFIRNTIDYVDFFNQRANNQMIKFFFPGFNPFSWRLHEFIVANLSISNQVINLLETRYWSNLPYRLGARAIKFSFKPSLVTNTPTSAPASDNYLREVMTEHLKTKPAQFDFLVQFQTDAEKMPIEDPTIDWDERQSPFQKVATIKIPVQEFNSPAQRTFCENLSFSPWRSLPEHTPLGGINRVRRKVYEAISALRHELNQVPRQEPTGDEVF